MDRLNDKDFCAGCKEAILDALSKVPPVRQQVWEPTDDYTAQELHDIEMERLRKAKEENPHGLYFRRIAAPLFDLRDPSNQNIVGFVKIDDIEYRYSWWTNDPEGTAEALYAAEKDCATGEILGPWGKL